ncbi:hypothetical protein D3C87_1519880 [compost metagenome]
MRPTGCCTWMSTAAVSSRRRNTRCGCPPKSSTVSTATSRSTTVPFAWRRRSARICHNRPARSPSVTSSRRSSRTSPSVTSRFPSRPRINAWLRFWWISCNRRRCMSVTCPMPAHRDCWAYARPCKPNPVTTGPWRIGRRRFTSVNGPWRGSLSASWA